MKKVILLLIIASILVLFACKEKTVRYTDSGETVTIMVGQVLKIELPGDATSGSDWRKMTYNDIVLQKKKKGNYMLSDNPSSPGVYYFRFTAIIPGTSHILMEYGNKYDDDKKATKTFELDVIVIPKQ